MACTMALNRALAEGQRCRCALLKWASSPNPSSPNAACWPEMTSDQLQQVTDFLKSLFQLRRTLHRRDKSGLSRIELCFFDLSFRTAQGAPESSFVILFCLFTLQVHVARAFADCPRTTQRYTRKRLRPRGAGVSK